MNLTSTLIWAENQSKPQKFLHLLPESVTTLSQLAAIVTWLEVTANFNLVNGKATAGMKGCRSGEKLKQSDGFKQLAEFVNERCNTTWDGKTAGARYKAYKKKYKKTKRAILDPSGKKFCLSTYLPVIEGFRVNTLRWLLGKDNRRSINYSDAFI